MAPRASAKTVELPVGTGGNRTHTALQVRGTHQEGGGSFRVKRSKECMFGVRQVPFRQQLKFEAGLKLLRRTWGATAPRYHYFYAVSPLLEDLA